MLGTENQKRETKMTYIPTVAVEISDIPDTTPRGIQVVIKKTGKTAWLPRRYVKFLPGHAIVPVWLLKKMGIGKDVTKPNKSMP